MIHTADVETLKLKIDQLQVEHRDLDDVISQLAHTPPKTNSSCSASRSASSS